MESAPCLSLDDWLAYCERLHPAAIALGLDRVREVAQRLNVRLDCPVITVAGTNGKGSTCAMLECILRHAGYRTGLYTSPHLRHFTERLQIAGQPVDAIDWIAAFADVEGARAGFGSEVALTFFEFTTLAALLVMQRAALDVAVLEVGLGGRLDAVNLIDADCAIITSIALDHVAWLGLDREAIGREKAGILRTGRPAVISESQPPASVLNHARDIGATLLRLGHEFHATAHGAHWQWRGLGTQSTDLPVPALPGDHQLPNAAGVLAALTALRDSLPVTTQAVHTGLSEVRWPGRLQTLPGPPQVVLDVAHNPHAVQALADYLRGLAPARRTHLVLGAMADKDLAGMVTLLQPLADAVYLCDLPLQRAAKAEDLRLVWMGGAEPGTAVLQTFADPATAYRAACAAADPADRIVVCGSFLTVGGVLDAQDGAAIPRQP